MNGPISQIVEPPHRRGPWARREYLTHKSIISWIEGRQLSVVTYMLHVSLTTVASKWWTGKMFGHLGMLHLFGEWWLGDPP